MLNWIKKNKEWVFSGLGVAIIAGIISLFTNSINDTENTVSSLEIRSSKVYFPGGKEATWVTRIINYSPTLSRELLLEFTFEIPLESVYVSRSQDIGEALPSEKRAYVTGKEITVVVPPIQSGEFSEIKVDAVFKEMLQGKVNALLVLKDKEGKVLDRSSSILERGPGSWKGVHNYEPPPTPIEHPEL